MFLTEFTAEHRAAIAASAWVCFDLETTGLTPTSSPCAVGASAKIGDRTWAVYRSATGATLNCRSRVRIVSVGLSAAAKGEKPAKLAWDVDALPHEDFRDLLRACIHGKCVVGHNLAFDYAWALHHVPDLQPAMTLDTLLLMRLLFCALPHAVHTRAAAGNEVCKQLAMKATTSASLAALMAAAGDTTPLDKSWQHPRNWCPSVLSKGHYDYVMSDVTAPVWLAGELACKPGLETTEAIIEALQARDKRLSGGLYFRVYQHVPLRLAAMASRGIPLHMQTLQAVAEHRTEEIGRLAEDVLEHIPQLREHAARLRSTQSGLPDALKQALAAYAATHGITLETTDAGNVSLGADAAKMAGLDKLEGWRRWSILQSAKKVLALCDEYTDNSLPDRSWEGYKRLHPVISAAAVTLRCKSENPNVQNLPRPRADLPDELQFRSIVRAPAGYKIVSADYGQIELRIAAALALRALASAEAAVSGALKDVPGWFVEALREGFGELPIADAEEGESFEAYRREIALRARAVSVRGTPMAEAFRAGVDPHLLTAVAMARRQGVMAFEGSPLAWLLAQPESERKALKKTLAAQRQAAKALNFGLLYGMTAPTLWQSGITDYGLAWTLQEAEEAREEWLDLYPEIALWQLWVKHGQMPSKARALPYFARNEWSKRIECTEERIGYGRTLAGRVVCATAPHSLGNYEDQGSGADMLHEALNLLPADCQPWLLNTIHDEVLMVVPDDRVEYACAQLQQAMLAAADRQLGLFNIPAEADPMVSQFWTKD